MSEPTPSVLSLDAAATAQEVIGVESQGLSLLAAALDPGQVLAAQAQAAVEAISIAKGRLIVTGMGKSGHVGRKIAATFASTGQTANYVHPGEASHGDLGMIEERDVVLALSNSGETPELADVLGYARRFSIPLIGMTSKAGSTLAKSASLPLVLPTAEEACHETSAPTTSTTMMMAMGDALAVTLLRARGFTKADFKTFHPGGKLGAQLRRVSDLIPEGRQVPVVPDGTPVLQAIETMSKAGFGCIGVVDSDGLLSGIITDGDLRRHASRLNEASVDEVMTQAPQTVREDTVAGEALSILTSRGITALFVVSEGKPVNLLHVHDCLQQGVL